MDNETRTILVPKQTKQFDIITLPDYEDIKQDRKYGKSGFKIYELKSIKESPKSIILEPGYILENSEVIMTTEFNPIYLMISALVENSKFNSRFVSVDDITDSFPWCEDIAIDYNLICDSIQENGETYYKVSKTKVSEFLHQKVKNVQTYLENSRLYNFLKMELYVVSESEITDEILALQLRQTSIDFIWNYLCIERFGDFVISQKLVDHKRRIQSELNSKMLMDAKPEEKKAPKLKKPVTKKAVKVERGKGALDSFFTKKA